MHDLKKNIGDTLSFLHQERNDFVPDDDIPITYSTKFENKLPSSTPKKTEEYIVEFPEEKETMEAIKEESNIVEISTDLETDAEELEKDSIELLTNVKETAAEVVENIINEAETLSLNMDDSIHLAMKKSEEAFEFLEHEPVTPIRQDFDNNDIFIKKETEFFSDNKNDIINAPVEKISVVTTKISTKNKSNIPKLKNKEKYLKDEKDIDVVLGDDDEIQDSLSPMESEILSRIPVPASNKPIKVKTIKKHSKDPLKDFVKMVNADGNWDESKFDNTFEQTTYTNTKIEPDGTVITTTTTEYSTGPEITETTTTTEYSTNPSIVETNSISSPVKSKIPVFINEATKLNSPTDSQKDIVDSDSDTDSRQSPPLRGILKKSSMRTLGSSSGSDIALHEAGGELSDDDTGKLNIFSI